MEQEKYQYLGKKTFLLFMLKRIWLFLIFLIPSLLLFLISRFLTGAYFLIIRQVGSFFIMLALIFLVAVLFYTWFEYYNFRFMLSGNAFKVRRGVIQKEEIAIPYRQIQSVNIKRNLWDQIFGISKLIILTAGEEDKEEKIRGESEAILPVIDKKLAQKLQEELLKRANHGNVI